MSRLAKIGKEISTNQFEILAIGSESYQLESGTTSVELTDWPTLDGLPCDKRDVYYSSNPINNKYFFCKYNSSEQRLESYKIEKIKKIRDELLDSTLFVTSRRMAKKDLIASGVIGVVLDMTNEEYKTFCEWQNFLGNLTSTSNLPTLKSQIANIAIEDITIENSTIFGIMPNIKKPNG